MVYGHFMSDANTLYIVYNHLNIKLISPVYETYKYISSKTHLY